MLMMKYFNETFAASLKFTNIYYGLKGFKTFNFYPYNELNIFKYLLRFKIIKNLQLRIM